MLEEQAKMLECDLENIRKRLEELKKQEATMTSGFGRGRGFGRGFGGGMGFGFRGASPPWPYVGIGRGGLPRCGYFLGGAGTPSRWTYQSPFYGQPAAPGYTPFTPQMSREQELDYLKDQAEAIKEQLEQIESRMRGLGSEQEE